MARRVSRAFHVGALTKRLRRAVRVRAMSTFISMICPLLFAAVTLTLCILTVADRQRLIADSRDAWHHTSGTESAT
jgi:hypothetical protein